MLHLLREANTNAIPLLGHCLGGQLISKVLGAVVSKSPVKEIGWGEVTVCTHNEAKKWFGELRALVVLIGMVKPLAYRKAQDTCSPAVIVRIKLTQ